jgi:hypothetical protein
MQSNLGRLEQVELRSIWANEAGDFTPWLAQEDNLRLLGGVIGIELELEEQEKDVGPFSADILCKDINGDSWVLIENQLERTDHTHLGQLITYAAGLQAVTIVWIASRLTEEHRAALDWLNDITDSKFQFFGLEIEVWKIGDSIAAPKFNVVSKPNDWVRGVATKRSQNELTNAQKLRLEFWTDFGAYCDENQTFFTKVKPRPQVYHNFSLGRGGFRLVATASFYDSAKETWANGELRTELHIDGVNSHAHFKALKTQYQEIEDGLERTLVWYEPENTRARSIYMRKEADLNDRTRWPEYHTWLVTELNAFHKYFSPIVRNLEP